MRPIADAVDRGPGPDRQHVGRVRLLPRRAHQRRDQERHQRAARLRCFDFFQDDALDARGYFENRRTAEESAAAQPVRLRDGRPGRASRSSTTAATRRSSWAPTKACAPTRSRARSLGADGADAAGQLLRDHARAIRNPVHRPAVPGNIIPPSQLSPIALKLLAVLPGAEPAGRPASTTCRARARRATRTTSSWSASIRTSATRSGSTSATTGTTAFNSNIGAIPVPGHHAAARQQEHAGLLHAHADADLLNDFRIGYHRIDFDTLNHFDGERHRRRPDRTSAFPASTATSGTTIPASRASTSATSAGSAAAARTGTSSTRRSRCRTCWPTRAARTTSAPASICGGWRPAGARRTTRAGASIFTGDMTGYSVADFMLGLPRTVITPADQIQGHVGGWRNGFFVNDVWQADAQPDAEPRPALRAATRRCRPTKDWPRCSTEDFETIIPTHASRRRVRVPRAEQQGLRAAARRDLSPRREDRAARRVTGSTTTRTR